MSTVPLNRTIGSSDANDLRVGSVTLARRVFGATKGMHLGTQQLVAMINSGATSRIEWGEAEGDRLSASIIASGQVVIGYGHPPVWISCAAPISTFAFCMDDLFVTRLHQQAFGGKGVWSVQRLVGFNDPVIERLCTLGRQEFDSGGTSGRLYAEALGTALAVHLLRNYGSVRVDATLPKGGLAPAQLQRVIQYMEAHLGEDLSLAELAEVAGLSAYHFGRSFKLATGMSPHRYLIEKRVQRVLQLLRDPALSIAEIAAAVGFASQSHLTANFRRVVGVTPARFRQPGN